MTIFFQKHDLEINFKLNTLNTGPRDLRGRSSNCLIMTICEYMSLILKKITARGSKKKGTCFGFYIIYRFNIAKPIQGKVVSGERAKDYITTTEQVQTQDTADYLFF